jgi:3-deoxy-D-manno-octulosonate 8-phosphate phosphatase (KDO 8-P phosphatase)
LKNKNKEAFRRFKNIELIVSDVDGVLTDNTIYIDDNGLESKKFSIADGVGAYLAGKYNLKLGIISARKSKATMVRAKQIRIKYVFLGREDKLTIYNKIKKNLKLKDSQIAYIGDDLVDIPVLKEAGISISVKDASPYVKKYADYITRAKGGQGVLREVIEIVLKSKNKKFAEYFK